MRKSVLSSILVLFVLAVSHLSYADSYERLSGIGRTRDDGKNGMAAGMNIFYMNYKNVKEFWGTMNLMTLGDPRAAFYGEISTKAQSMSYKYVNGILEVTAVSGPITWNNHKNVTYVFKWKPVGEFYEKGLLLGKGMFSAQINDSSTGTGPMLLQITHGFIGYDKNGSPVFSDPALDPDRFDIIVNGGFSFIHE